MDAFLNLSIKKLIEDRSVSPETIIRKGLELCGNDVLKASSYIRSISNSIVKNNSKGVNND